MFLSNDSYARVGVVGQDNTRVFRAPTIPPPDVPMPDSTVLQSELPVPDWYTGYVDSRGYAVPAPPGVTDPSQIPEEGVDTQPAMIADRCAMFDILLTAMQQRFTKKVQMVDDKGEVIQGSDKYEPEFVQARRELCNVLTKEPHVWMAKDDTDFKWVASRLKPDMTVPGVAVKAERVTAEALTLLSDPSMGRPLAYPFRAGTGPAIDPQDGAPRRRTPPAVPPRGPNARRVSQGGRASSGTRSGGRSGGRR